MNVSHICFRRALKAQGIDPNSLAFKAPFAPYFQYFSMIIILFIMGCEFYLALFPSGSPPSAEAFFTIYLALPLFIVDYFAYKV